MEDNQKMGNGFSKEDLIRALESNEGFAEIAVGMVTEQRQKILAILETIEEWRAPFVLAALMLLTEELKKKHPEIITGAEELVKIVEEGEEK